MNTSGQDRSSLNILIDDSENFSADLEDIEDLTNHICHRFDITEATVNIVIADDKKISEFNKRFLGKLDTTDVISFDLSDENLRSFDIIVNAEMAKRQAKLRSHSIKAELALYITHGLLHNMGFDDADLPDAQKMHEMENLILTESGYGSVYGPIQGTTTVRKDNK